MLRELLDIAVIEDFASGLARSTGLAVGVYDAAGAHIAGAHPPGACEADHPPTLIEPGAEFVAVRAAEPPARVAFVGSPQRCFVVAPVHVDEQLAGYLAAGPCDRRPAITALAPGAAHNASEPPAENVAEPTSAAPASGGTRLVREPGSAIAAGYADSPASSGAPAPRDEAWTVYATRWGARMLSAWCRHEWQINAAAQEVALVGDIGQLISGERNLQKVLDQIVAETARVMKCHFASLRLYNPDTDELTISAVFNLSREYISKGRVLRSENPIDDEALDGHVVYTEDMQTDPRVRFPDEARRLGIVSGLTVGMHYHGRPIGVLRIYDRRKRRFRVAQRNLLRAVAAQAAAAVVNARLVEERLRTADFERQLALAGEVQTRMLPPAPPQHPRIDSAMIYEPSFHVGGDFCDLFFLPDGRLAALVGDVAGHGMPAALLMASVRGALRAVAQTCSDLGELLTRLNTRVYRETATNEFVTLALIAIDRDARRLSYCLAGHEPPLLLRAGTPVAMNDGGLILGLNDAERYAESSLPLEPADLLVLYTDGLVEALDFRGRPFGRERLLSSIRLHAHQPIAQLLRNVHWDVRRFVGLAEQADDLTMVGLKIRD